VGESGTEEVWAEQDPKETPANQDHPDRWESLELTDPRDQGDLPENPVCLEFLERTASPDTLVSEDLLVNLVRKDCLVLQE